MNGKGTYFFATRADMETVIREIENTTSLLYTATGLFLSPQKEFNSALSLPDFGTMHNGHQALETSYLVVAAEQPIEIRKILQSDDSVRYAIDQLQNPHSIVFQPSGIYNSKAIIMGVITTISVNPRSLDLYRLFSKKLKKDFQKMDTSYVGPEATVLARQGYRLTNDINRPVSYDLKI